MDNEKVPASALTHRRPTGYPRKNRFMSQCGNLQKMINRKKTLTADMMSTSLKRCLNTFDICLLGVGHMIGAGIYVLTGEVAKQYSGPAIVVSYIIAGITSFLAAVCYAEFSTRVPKAGSAYIYTYVTIGEFWAFVIGWDVILEHMIGSASVARAWSSYLDDGLLNHVIRNWTMDNVATFDTDFISAYPDFVAFAVCSVVCILLVVGVKFSSIFNSIFTCLNLVVILCFVCVGFYFARIENWTDVPGGFFPFGISGVVAGAAKCFYAFVGFDSIATSSEEAKNPGRSIPLATFLCMAISTVCYVTMSIVLTLMIPYNEIDANAAFPGAFEHNGAHWAAILVSVGALAGMTTTMFGGLFSLPRTVYAMATDGLLFPCFAYVHPKTQTPIVTLVTCSLITALIALFFDISSLVNFMSIGTLMAYTIVSVSVIVLRYQPSENPQSLTKSTDIINSENDNKFKEFDNGGTVRKHFKLLRFLEQYEPGYIPTVAAVGLTSGIIAICFTLQYAYDYLAEASWWAILIIIASCLVIAWCMFILYIHEQSSQELVFAVPLVPLIPGLSVFCNIYLMAHLDWVTWVRFAVWMLVGMLIYFCYGIRHSKEKVRGSSPVIDLMLPETSVLKMADAHLNDKDKENGTPNYYVTKF